MSNANLIQNRIDTHVIATYGRFPLTITHGNGSYVFTEDGRQLLDLGAGIATACLGHGHPELATALAEQAKKITHISNLYYTEPQSLLAEKLVHHAGGHGKIFFCNSGAEANEGLYKLARLHGHTKGRYEIITAENSFHGRTLAGIAATGQNKVKQGFNPPVEGFRHVPFNDLEAMRATITEKTAAILIEGVQGEGGIYPATPEYLIGLRKLCTKKNILLMMDSVQCGFFRTGNFQSWQTILKNSKAHEFKPDAFSLAKSLGAGLPMGAFWVNENLQDVLVPGSHGTTFGGTPLVSAHALKALEIIERDDLAKNAISIGNHFTHQIQNLIRTYPSVLKEVRGLGMMIGIELTKSIPAFSASNRPASLQIVELLHDAGLLTIPAGASIFRLLPPLNLSQTEANEGLDIIERVIKKLAS